MIKDRDKDYIVEFGKNLRKLRLKANLTQEELGNNAEISKNQVGLIERGEINVTLSTLKKIAKHLGVHPKALLDF